MDAPFDETQRIILLLPGPDKGQVAACHKYLERSNNAYSGVYTVETIKGDCSWKGQKNALNRTLVIGHGLRGGILFGAPEPPDKDGHARPSASATGIANTIVASGRNLNAGYTVAFDNCYAFQKANWGASLLDQVKKELVEHASVTDLNLNLVGCRGATSTIAAPAKDRSKIKRLVVLDDKKKNADASLETLTKKHHVDPGDTFDGWIPDASPEKIRGWAASAHGELLGLCEEFRDELSSKGWVDATPERKVKVKVVATKSIE